MEELDPALVLIILSAHYHDKKYITMPEQDEELYLQHSLFIDLTGFFKQSAAPLKPMPHFCSLKPAFAL